VRRPPILTPFACACAKRDWRHPGHDAAYTFHYSFGNKKLVDNIIAFGLPAYRSQAGFPVCLMAGSCAFLCYARQGQYVLPTVQTPREHNLAWLRTHSAEAFAQAMSADLAAMHPSWQIVRIHDGGDFFTLAYLRSWIEIARQHPALQFYGYTKMIRLLHRVWDDLPANMRLVQSFGGKEDRYIDTARPHARIFATRADLEASGYTDASTSDAPTYSGAVRIGLIYHGSIPLRAEWRAQLQTSAAEIESVASLDIAAWVWRQTRKGDA
jgi:Gene product 88